MGEEANSRTLKDSGSNLPPCAIRLINSIGLLDTKAHFGQELESTTAEIQMLASWRSSEIFLK